MTTFAIICRSADPAQERHVARQAEALTNAGHAVDIFAPRWPELSARLRGTRARVVSLGYAPPVSSVLRAAFFWLVTFVTITLAQLRSRYQVIQIIGPMGIFAFTPWLARLFGARVVVDQPDAIPERLMARAGLPRSSARVRVAVLLEEMIVDFADHLITTTEPLRSRYISRGCPPEKISVIYVSPDEDRFSRRLTVTRHARLEGRFLVTCHAATPGTMDYETAIRAVLALRASLPAALLWIVAPREDVPLVERLVIQCDAAQHVIVQGPLAEDDLPTFIAQADVHLVPLTRDALTDLALPLETLESLSLGVATVAVRTLATHYYFDARSLSVYDHADAAQLAARILWLAQHPEARIDTARYSRELIAQIYWSRERHRYVALLKAIAVADTLATLSPAASLASQTRLTRQRRLPIREYRAMLRKSALEDPTREPESLSQTTSPQIALRLSAPSSEWRASRQFRMRLGAWGLRGIATALLFGIPIVATHDNITAKIITALMFALVAFVMVLLPSGEAAIIVGFYFITQRALFLAFPPEGILGRVIVYLGTALQLIVFIGFGVRAIIQQRPLLRSGFVLWPAAAYFIASLLSAFLNHVPLSVMVLGIEHTLHNLVFVVLIAEDLPTPQLLRTYVSFAIIAITGLALITLTQTGVAFHVLPHALARIPLLNPQFMPTAVIVPDADTFGYLLNFGILLALGAFISRNITEGRFDRDEDTPTRLNLYLLGAVVILTLAQFVTSSVANWLGLIAGAVALAILLRGNLRWVIVGYLAVVLALTFVPFAAAPGQPATATSQDIVAIFHGQLPHNAPLAQSLRVASVHPLYGVGPGRFGGTVAYITHSPIYSAYGFARPRAVASINLFWLHILGETGIIGLGIFLWLMVMTARAVIRAHRHGAHQQWWGVTAGVFGIIVAMSVATFFGNALEIDSLAAPFWALVGIAVALPMANRPLYATVVPPLRFRAPEDTEDAPPPVGTRAGNQSLPPRRRAGNDSLGGRKNGNTSIPGRPLSGAGPTEHAITPGRGDANATYPPSRNARRGGEDAQ